MSGRPLPMVEQERPWRPVLGGRARPVYRAIVRALADDIRSGALAPGTRLPTQRQLAQTLGVTVSTVTRAYKHAQAMGLLSSQVGRGSFVAIPSWSSAGWDLPETRLRRTGQAAPAQSTVDFLLHRPSLGLSRSILPLALGDLAEHYNLRSNLDYPTPTGAERHRIAGAAWVALAGVNVDPSCVILCSGAQQALFAAIAANTNPGDAVLVEHLNYVGIRRIADLLRVRLIGVQLTASGMDLDALETLCAVHAPKLLVCTPTMHNPTTISMPWQDRQSLLSVTARHGVLVVEDDVFGPLAGPEGMPLRAMAEEGVIYISSTSKALAPGLRCGYLVVPARETERYAWPILTSTWGPSPLLADFVTDWIENGVAGQMIERQLDLSAKRVRLAQAIIGGRYNLRADPRTFHTWLVLPPGWDGEALAMMLGSRNVMISPGSLFAVDRGPVGAVRLSLGSAETTGQLRLGLESLVKILDRGSPLV